MRKLLLSGAAALSIATLPIAASAQDSGAVAPAEAAPATAAEANAAAPPRTETTVTTRATDAGEQEVITKTASNAAPPPASALDKDYPICRGAVTDGCQNPGEGGAPGRSRALDHWPGAPASELHKAHKTTK